MADIFSIPAAQIGLESSSDTIDSWDSLQHLNLVLSLEQAFGVQFTAEEIGQLSSVERIVSVLDLKLQSSGTQS
jgi:acyl carrier protein